MEGDEAKQDDRNILCYSLANGWQLELVPDHEKKNDATPPIKGENRNIDQQDGRVVVCTLSNFTGKVIMIPPAQQPAPLKSTAEDATGKVPGTKELTIETTATMPSNGTGSKGVENSIYFNARQQQSGDSLASKSTADVKK